MGLQCLYQCCNHHEPTIKFLQAFWLQLLDIVIRLRELRFVCFEMPRFGETFELVVSNFNEFNGRIRKSANQSLKIPLLRSFYTSTKTMLRHLNHQKGSSFPPCPKSVLPHFSIEDIVDRQILGACKLVWWKTLKEVGEDPAHKTVASRNSDSFQMDMGWIYPIVFPLSLINFKPLLSMWT